MMCNQSGTKPLKEVTRSQEVPPSSLSFSHKDTSSDSDPPLTTLLEPPSFLARSTCISILVGSFAVWGKYAFVDESAVGQVFLHHWSVPLGMTFLYLISLPLLRLFSSRFLSKSVDVKMLLMESMVLYNAGQVLLNLWMVYRIIHALVFRGHPLIGGPIDLVDTGTTYAVWIHYCDKYLEFFDTYFMVLRGKMDQVSFLHVYHHTSIAWAWWIGLKFYPGGDIYFGALVNSLIHVMMYSYYTLSLLKIHCPWKKYLTQAQLLQFMSVVAYSISSLILMPKEGNWRHYLAYSVQVFEMVSLFVLFMHFYRKAYAKRKFASRKQESSETASTDSSDSGADAQPEQSSVSSVSSDEM